MDRRGPTRLILALLVATITLLAPATATYASGDEPAATQVPVTAEPDTGTADAPPVTVSDFYPEDNNLSDCVGLVEKPGCGSQSRGGWRQVVVFAVLMGGMGFIFWRISVGVRGKRTGDIPDEVEEHVDH